MQLAALDNLRQRLPPSVDRFHSTEQNLTNPKYLLSGVTYWKKANFTHDYCEARNGFVCQRSAAAGASAEANGKNKCFNLNFIFNKIFVF